MDRTKSLIQKKRKANTVFSETVHHGESLNAERRTAASNPRDVGPGRPRASGGSGFDFVIPSAARNLLCAGASTECRLSPRNRFLYRGSSASRLYHSRGQSSCALPFSSSRSC